MPALFRVGSVSGTQLLTLKQPVDDFNQLQDTAPGVPRPPVSAPFDSSQGLAVL